MVQQSSHKHYVLFALGAATGSALGLIIGSLLAYWFGEEAVESISRAFRRLTGRSSEPNFELFLQ